MLDVILMIGVGILIPVIAVAIAFVCMLSAGFVTYNKIAADVLIAFFIVCCISTMLIIVIEKRFVF